MPLSPPAPRAPIHQRVIDCQGFRREDGLWDIEAHLTDTKSYAFSNAYRPKVVPGEPLHGMLMRLTLDEAYTVVAIECASEHTPHAECGAILPNFQRLVGLSIGPGWKKTVKALVGGAEGCAHHGELLGVLATVAFQTMGPLLARKNMAAGTNTESVASGNFLINSCHIWREGGEWARMFREDPAGALGNRQIPVETD